MLKDYAGLFRALADIHRLKIIDILASESTTPDSENEAPSYNGISASLLLKDFSFTQPTLSHHMKILCESGLVSKHKEGKNIYYSLDKEGLLMLKGFIKQMLPV
ncbi:MAG: helix-turn-helix domain-containing protein [Treponema sp.]|nr:helix-turn-helix domain-containing protein [Treponema sp.]